MLVGVLITAVGAGLCAAVAALLLGQGIWLALAAYAGVGCATALGVVLLRVGVRMITRPTSLWAPDSDRN